MSAGFRPDTGRYRPLPDSDMPLVMLALGARLWNDFSPGYLQIGGQDVFRIEADGTVKLAGWAAEQGENDAIPE